MKKLLILLIFILSIQTVYAKEFKSGIDYPQKSPLKEVKQEVILEELPEPKMDDYFYYYPKLNDEQKEMYKLFYFLSDNMDDDSRFVLKKETSLSYIEQLDVLRAYTCDYPERAFIVALDVDMGTVRRDGEVLQYVCLENTISRAEETAVKADMEKFVNGITKGISKSSPKAYIQYVITKRLCDKCDYYNKQHSYFHICHTMYGKKGVVCDGYSALYKYCLRKFGIDCVNIFGRAMGGGHLWSVVKLDKWYECDVTNCDEDEFLDYFLYNNTTKWVSTNDYIRYIRSFPGTLAPEAYGTHFKGDYVFAGNSYYYMGALDPNEWGYDIDKLPKVCRLYANGKPFKKGSKTRTISVHCSNKDFNKHIYSIKYENLSGKIKQSGKTAKAKAGRLPLPMTPMPVFRQERNWWSARSRKMTSAMKSIWPRSVKRPEQNRIQLPSPRLLILS